MFGGIEGGGTKFVCGVGTGPGDLQLTSFPTTSAQDTVNRVREFFCDHGKHLDAVGIGSFGPVDLHRESATFGYITSTPKKEWQFFDLAGAVRHALGVPVGFDTDVNAAVLGEARWGAGIGAKDFVYLTVGTGIGGGAIVNGEVLHGLVHPEMGHIRIPHDLKTDPYQGGCPYHQDCLEGLASGPAMQSRWGVPPGELPLDHPGWKLEAHYLAAGLATWVCTISPEKFILGGGVMRQQHLFPLIRAELKRLLNDYIQADELLVNIDKFVIPPQLGQRSGVLGALVLAEREFQHQNSPLRRAKVGKDKYAT